MLQQPQSAGAGDLNSLGAALWQEPPSPASKPGSGWVAEGCCASHISHRVTICGQGREQGFAGVHLPRLHITKWHGDTAALDGAALCRAHLWLARRGRKDRPPWIRSAPSCSHPQSTLKRMLKKSFFKNRKLIWSEKNAPSLPLLRHNGVT